MQRLTTFKQWFLQEVMCVESRTTIVILPIQSIRETYRDVPPSYLSLPTAPKIPLTSFRPPKMPSGIGMLDIAPTLGAPELVIPSMRKVDSGARLLMCVFSRRVAVRVTH